MKAFDTLSTDADFARALADFDAAFVNLPLDKRNTWSLALLFRDAGEESEKARNVGLTIANDVFNSLCFGTLGEDGAQPLGEDVAAIAKNFQANKEPFDGLLSPDGSAPRRPVHPVARLRTEHYDALGRICNTINVPQLRARVADFLWITRRDFRAAQVAIDAYLQASRVERAKDWVGGLLFLKRALRIERELNLKNGAAFREVESELQNHKGDLTFYSSWLMKLMLELRVGNAPACATLAEAAAQAAETEPEWHRAEAYWDLAIQWHRRAKNPLGENTAQWALAACYEKHAAFILARPGQNAPFSHAEHWIGCAVATLRKIGDPAAATKAQDLHQLLLDYQRRALREMQPMLHPVDLSPMVQDAQQKVQGLSLIEALARFALLHQPSSLRALCRSSHSIAKETPFLSRTAKRQISFSGGTAAFEKKMDDERKDKRERRRVRMIGHARLQQELAALGSLSAGLQVLISEHRLNEAAFLPLLEGCLFVPPGHERLFARALVMGAQDDWMASAHLLVPQIEAGFRALLLGFGATPPPEVQRGEREWGLQDFLFDARCWNILSSVFGEALLYDARVLLAEKFGANLRPHLTHGLVPDGAFGSQFTLFLIYLWWLALRLVFSVLHVQPALLSSSGAEDGSTSDSSL